MGAEVTGGEKAIRTFLLWGCLIVMAAYLWATWGNMVVIEAGGANGTTGGAETVGLALGRWAGAAVSLVMAWVVLTVAVVYNYSFGRLLFVSGMEKRLPHQIGKVNKNKVPANAITLQSAISTILAVLVFFVLGGGETDPYKYFYILYAGVTIVWCISTALLFLDIFFAKRAEPERFERERRVPARLAVSSAVSWGSWSTSSRCSSSSWARGTRPGSRRSAEWNCVDDRLHGRLGDLGHRDLVRVAVRETRQDRRAADRRGPRRSRDRRRMRRRPDRTQPDPGGRSPGPGGLPRRAIPQPLEAVERVGTRRRGRACRGARPRSTET